MPLDRVTGEVNLTASDLNGMEVVRIASTVRPGGDELAARVPPLSGKSRVAPPPRTDRPTLTVFIENPDDAGAGARIAALLGLTRERGWH